MESSHTSPALAVHVVALEVLAVVTTAELAVVFEEEEEEEEQTPLVQVSPVAQFPVYVPQVAPSEPPVDPYWQYQSVVPSQELPPLAMYGLQESQQEPPTTP